MPYDQLAYSKLSNSESHRLWSVTAALRTPYRQCYGDVGLIVVGKGWHFEHG